MKLFRHPAVIVIIAVLTVCAVFAFTDKTTHTTQPSDSKVPLLRYESPPLPDRFNFAGEEVPLSDRTIREQWDREVLLNYYSPASTLYVIKLSRRYFPLIEERLKANGIPDDMKYLCIAESNLQQLVSKAGAAGFWQFMPGTAPSYGLEVNAHVDERYHIAKATDAACIYLKNAYAKFGSWTAAAASYNCGMGGYNEQATFQGTSNYYDLLLPEETNRYIFRILTFKYFLQEAVQLGFDVADDEGYTPHTLRSVTVEQTIPNLASFAKAEGTTYKIVKRLNPWLRGRTLPVRKGKTYTIVLPATGAAAGQ